MKYFLYFVFIKTCEYSFMYPFHLLLLNDCSFLAPKGLFPPEPEHYRGPKLKVAIIGAGLAGMSTAVELLDQGHEVTT